MNQHDANKAYEGEPSYEELDLIPLDEVLAKGTIFKELYEPYKIIPKAPQPESDEAKAMQELQTYAIAALDLNLYLDTHPQDREAITFYNEVVCRFKKAKDAYEKRYGPICLYSDALKSYPWTWTMANWPWMGDEK